MTAMRILIDNGHGFDTPGKCSPDGYFREYAYTRYLAVRIKEQLSLRGLDAEYLVPEREDIPLAERCRRVNTVCNQLGSDQVILLSLHVNAAGDGRHWLDARGWSCYTSPGQTRADSLATCLYDSAKRFLPGMKLRTGFADGDPDLEENFYILRHTLCPAVLTENLYMDNHADVAFLASEAGAQAIIALHVDGVVRFLSR